MRVVLLIPLLVGLNCAPFVQTEVLEIGVQRTRLRGPTLRGLAMGPHRYGGQGPTVRLDADPLQLQGDTSGAWATCDGGEEDDHGLVAGSGCGPAHGYGMGAGGLGMGGAGAGGGGMLARGGAHPGLGLIEQAQSRVRRELSASPWGWAVIDLPYRDGPVAQFPARPEVHIAQETSVRRDELSTFGVDVDTAAYSIARRALLSGARPEPTLVRPEEMLNAFSYHYPEPAGLVGVSTDGARSPYGADRYLLRVGLQARHAPAQTRGPINLVFLIDTSCSMAGSDRLDLVKDSVHFALAELGPTDQIAIATYAGSTQVVLPPTPATDRAAVQAALTALTAHGGTSMATGLDLAYLQAEAMHQPGEHSHVVVCSDGDANIGPSNADALLASISEHARKGVALSTVGFGTGNYRDRVMERLANEGDGSYAYVDSPRQARGVFGTELLRTLQNVAKDVKIQVALDADAVMAWRLVGYENRTLRHEQFEDDTVDAGDVGSGHQVTALYELKLRPQATGRLGEIRVRARPFEGGPTEVLRHQVDVRTIAHPFEHATTDLRLATAVLGFAELLRHSPYAQTWRLQDVLRVAMSMRPDEDPDRAEFVALLESLRILDATAKGAASPSEDLSAPGGAAGPRPGPTSGPG